MHDQVAGQPSAQRDPTIIPDLPSLDVCFDLAQKQLDAQRARFGNLDTKASFVLGSASILTAAVTGLHGAAANVRPPNGLVAFGLAVLPPLAIFAYAAVVLAAFLAYTLRSIAWTPTVTRLNDYYVTKDPRMTKGKLLDAMKGVHEENEQSVEGKWGKATWTQIALWALLSEAALIALLTLVQATLPAPPPAH
jgi:hypothetical protein